MDYPPDYLRGIALFNRGDYFESHETWEDVWRATATPEREFYQGLIQVAVCLCHMHNGNTQGARRLFDRAIGHMAPFRPAHMGLNLERFIEDVHGCFTPVRAAERDQSVAVHSVVVPKIELSPSPVSWPDMEEFGDEPR